MHDNTIKFFTQDASIYSPTLYKKVNTDEDKGEFPVLKMTAEVSVSDQGESLAVTVVNKMFDDPLLDEDGLSHPISVDFELNIKQCRYLKRFIDAFLENQ